MKRSERRAIQFHLQAKKQQLRSIKRQLKSVKKERAELDKILPRLKQIIDETEGFTSAGKGAVFLDKMKIREGATLTPDHATGNWIITARMGQKVLMTKFKDFVNDVALPAKLEINMPASVYGTDGLEVTFNKGDLIACTFEGDMRDNKGKKEAKFHFANLGTGTPEAEAQYQYALGKLGLASVTEKKAQFSVVDANFRVRKN